MPLIAKAPWLEPELHLTALWLQAVVYETTTLWRLDLTRFGFTPTESLVYEVLLKHGPGTGYAIASAAGLARANAYSALEGLVSKGAARVEAGRPRRYRPEAPAGLIARISSNHGTALEQLSTELERLPAESARRWSRSTPGAQPFS